MHHSVGVRQLGEDRIKVGQTGCDEQVLKPVQFQNDDPEALESLYRRIDQDVIFGAFDIHLEQEVVIFRSALSCTQSASRMVAPEFVEPRNFFRNL